MNLTEQQKTDATKALCKAIENYRTHQNPLLLMARLTNELAKVELAIQPIKNKPLLKDMPTCE